ncbi:unnamed protein product, partial [Brachionus calyciflorus]
MVLSIMSDQGVNFKSKLFQEFSHLFSIKKLNSTFYHPSSNGQVERMVKAIKKIITMYVNISHNNWDEFLQASVSAYNCSKQCSIKYSPYEVLFRLKPVRVADFV